MALTGITGGAGGGGGFQSSSSTSATSGDADGLAGSGNKQFFFGGNPNAGQATSAIVEVLSNPFVIIGAVALVWVAIKKKR